MPGGDRCPTGRLVCPIKGGVFRGGTDGCPEVVQEVGLVLFCLFLTSRQDKLVDIEIL